MNKVLLHPDVQDFIRSNLRSNLSELILKGSPFPEITVQELAVQISGLKKAETKLPFWFSKPGIIFPPNLNLEQTSSEVTARHKAELTNGRLLIDLTGGFGIDSYFFSKNVEEVIHCEINTELSETAQFNFNVLGAENIRTISGDGIKFLKTSEEKFDFIYIDPARRDDYGGKVFLLEQCTPNVSKNLSLFFSKTQNILIKTSPLLDLSAGIAELENVREIQIISVNNEVKELLWILKKGFDGKILISTWNYLPKKVENFASEYKEEHTEISFNYPKKYLYEPNPAIMKSGQFAALAEETGTSKLHKNSHLFTSEEPIEFPGRSFEVLKVIPYNKKQLRNLNELKKANIATRNFPKTVAQLRKEHKIADGGEWYVFFTTGPKEEKLVVICKKLNTLR